MTTKEMMAQRALKNLYKAIDAIGDMEDHFGSDTPINNMTASEAITALHEVMFDLEARLGIERKH